MKSSDAAADSLKLMHEVAALRKANEHLLLAMKAMQEEPGRDTLAAVDQMLIEAGLINQSTQQAVRDLIIQRNTAYAWREETHTFLERLVRLDDPHDVEGVQDRRTITLNDIIAEAVRLKDL